MVEKRSKKETRKDREKKGDPRKEGSQRRWRPAGRTICSRGHQGLALATVSTLATSGGDSWLGSRVQGSLPSGHSPAMDWQTRNPSPEHKNNKPSQDRHPEANLSPLRACTEQGLHAQPCVSWCVCAGTWQSPAGATVEVSYPSYARGSP